jgi:single-strand DNA-binding protein
MAGSLNRATLIGNVGKDPEVKTTQAGKKIINLTLATSESWTDKQSGERKERTEWHRIVCFHDNLGSVIERFVRKGSKIMVEGQIMTRKWQDQTGADRYSTEIVLQGFDCRLLLLSDNRSGDNASETRPAPQQTRAAPAQTRQQAPAPSGYTGDLDDEIPF